MGWYADLRNQVPGSNPDPWRAMNILSIQSTVAYGHVGNSAAVFPLQRLGHEVWPVNTVQFSNHPAYGDWRGRVSDTTELAEIIRGVAERGVLARCDAVLSGYLGDAALGEVVLDAVAEVRAANRRAIYCCDPVMGSIDRGFFVRPGIPEFFRERAVPKADIVIPNAFELEYLSGRPAATLEDALAAADMVRGMGPSRVVVTGLRRTTADKEETITALAVGEGEAWAVETPYLEAPSNGAGDAFSALFLAHFLVSRETSEALSRSVSAIYAIMAATREAGVSELQIVAAQDQIVRPNELFKAERLR